MAKRKRFTSEVEAILASTYKEITSESLQSQVGCLLDMVARNLLSLEDAESSIKDRIRVHDAYARATPDFESTSTRAGMQDRAKMIASSLVDENGKPNQDALDLIDEVKKVDESGVKIRAILKRYNDLKSTGTELEDHFQWRQLIDPTPASRTAKKARIAKEHAEYEARRLVEAEAMEALRKEQATKGMTKAQVKAWEKREKLGTNVD